MKSEIAKCSSTPLTLDFSSSLNFLGSLDLANLQPLKYIDQEQPKEKHAPPVSSDPWHIHVLLGGDTRYTVAAKTVIHSN